MNAASAVHTTRLHFDTPGFATELRDAATLILFEHESFHHTMESAAIRMSLAMGGTPVYEEYSNTVYRPSFGTDDCIEEAIANAQMYKAFARPSKGYREHFSIETLQAVTSFLPRFFKTSPPGYQRASEYLTGGKLTLGRDEALQALLSATPNRSPHPEAIPHLRSLSRPLVSTRYRPTFWVQDGDTGGQPPAGWYQFMDPRDARVLLRSAGYREDGQTGSHQMWRGGDPPRKYPLPSHSGDLSMTVAKSLAGLLGVRVIDLRNGNTKRLAKEIKRRQ